MADFGAGNCPFRYPSDVLGFLAWRDFVAFAISRPDLREAFTRDTGKAFRVPPKTGLDAMIDRACGADDRETMADFIEWLNVTQWGEDMVSVQPLPPACSEEG